MQNQNLFSLFYVDSAIGQYPNLPQTTERNDLYLMCAVLCAKSCKAAGLRFSLITNDAAFVRTRLSALGVVDDISIVPHEFRLPVPKDIPFYSAHFKIELVMLFGTSIFGERVGLIDLDTVILEPIAIRDDITAYDISDQIFGHYGTLRAKSEMEILCQCKLPSPRWFGGEFIAGTRDSFERLSGYIEQCWKNYVLNVDMVGHLGDEMVMSSALNAALADGCKVVDIGGCGEVARWWTGRTRHRQIAFDSLQAAVLHLPGDKPFLAGRARYAFDPTEFMRRFRRHAKRKIMIRRLAQFVTRRRDEAMFTSRLR